MSESADDPARGTQFRLSYEMRLEDVQHLVATRAKRKDLRTRAVVGVVSVGFPGAILTVATVALDLRSAAQGSSGAPSWIYVADAILWLLFIWCVRASWRLNPRRLARRSWTRRPQLQGRRQDLIDQAGVTSIMPDGSQTIVPWSSVNSVDETKEVFRLVDDLGKTRVVLFKRAVPRPDLIPALRDFISRSVDASRAEDARGH